VINEDSLGFFLLQFLDADSLLEQELEVCLVVAGMA